MPANFALVAEAGCTLASVQQAAAAADRFFPLSLGSEGSCQIGGNLATNAGGTAVLRYGMMRDLTFGIEAVLADGSVLSQLSPLRKDNTGYDLRHLLIGSEGTLAVIHGGLPEAVSCRTYHRHRVDRPALCGRGGRAARPAARRQRRPPVQLRAAACCCAGAGAAAYPWRALIRAQRPAPGICWWS